MSLACSLLPPAHRSLKQADDVCPISSKSKDIGRAFSGDSQVKFENTPSIFYQGRRPKLAVHNVKRGKIGDDASLRVAPLSLKWAHRTLPPAVLDWFLAFYRGRNNSYAVTDANKFRAGNTDYPQVRGTRTFVSEVTADSCP